MFTHLIFDLDETLYPRSSGLMLEIGRRIGLYLIQRMGMQTEEANQLRRYFFARYGTTLRGLQVERQVDADDYLRFVHDIRLEDYIAPNPALAAMLQRIPLPKVIFTNADADHARRVLARLGVADHFERIFDIYTTAFYSKPDPRAYEIVLGGLSARGPECIMVEDNVRNLRPAKQQFGMATLLVDAPAGGDEDGIVDVTVAHLLELESALAGLSNHRT